MAAERMGVMTRSSEAYKNWRLNTLAGIAFVTVILCLIIVVFVQVTDEWARGVILVILGRFLGYVDNVYSFEFGTTRGDKAKDSAITDMAAASPTAPSKIAAAVVAGTGSGGNGTTLKAEDVNITAEGDVTVEGKK